MTINLDQLKELVRDLQADDLTILYLNEGEVTEVRCQKADPCYVTREVELELRPHLVVKEYRDDEPEARIVANILLNEQVMAIDTRRFQDDEDDESHQFSSSEPTGRWQRDPSGQLLRYQSAKRLDPLRVRW